MTEKMTDVLNARAQQALDKIIAGARKAYLYDYDPEQGACYELDDDGVIWLRSWSAYPPQERRIISTKATRLYQAAQRQR